MQSMHAVGASSSLVQREECHHLAPADTSIPLQIACVCRDAAADRCKLQWRYLCVRGHEIIGVDIAVKLLKPLGPS